MQAHHYNRFRKTPGKEVLQVGGKGDLESQEAQDTIWGVPMLEPWRKLLGPVSSQHRLVKGDAICNGIPKGWIGPDYLSHPFIPRLASA